MTRRKSIFQTQQNGYLYGVMKTVRHTQDPQVQTRQSPKLRRKSRHKVPPLTKKLLKLIPAGIGRTVCFNGVSRVKSTSFQGRSHACEQWVHIKGIKQNGVAPLLSFCGLFAVAAAAAASSSSSFSSPSCLLGSLF